MFPRCSSAALDLGSSPPPPPPSPAPTCHCPLHQIPPHRAHEQTSGRSTFCLWWAGAVATRAPRPSTAAAAPRRCPAASWRCPSRSTTTCCWWVRVVGEGWDVGCGGSGGGRGQVSGRLGGGGVSRNKCGEPWFPLPLPQMDKTFGCGVGAAASASVGVRGPAQRPQSRLKPADPTSPTWPNPPIDTPVRAAAATAGLRRRWRRHRRRCWLPRWRRALPTAALASSSSWGGSRGSSRCRCEGCG